VRRQRQRKPTFTPKAVCQALGIPSGTLNSWAFHGWFKGLDAEKTTPGKARRFTLDDLLRLAILKHLVDFGITAERARPWALLCVRYMDEAKFSEMSILANRDGVDEIRLDDDLMSEPPRPGVLLRLKIYPAEIVAGLKERFGIGTPLAEAKQQQAD
jgi:MerR HTH family regulatory protein